MAARELCIKSGLQTRERSKALTGKWFPNRQAFRRYCDKDVKPGKNGDRPPRFQGDKRFLNALAVTASDTVTARRELSNLNSRVIDEFLAQLEAPEVQGSSASADEETVHLIGTLFSVLGTKRNLVQPAIDIFFGTNFEAHARETRRYFETYRFAVQPGFVDKSFTVINSPSLTKDFVDFKNFYREETDDERRTSGIALHFQHGTFLLGVIGDGDALKTIYLSNAGATRKSFKGGTMSTSGSKIISGRLLMKETVVSDSRMLSEAGRLAIGTHALRDVGPELGGMVETLRNRIGFNVERPIMMKRKTDYELVGQADMVAATNTALRDGTKPIFIFEDDGQPFNPAEDRHYTFNSALSLE